MGAFPPLHRPGCLLAGLDDQLLHHLGRLGIDGLGPRAATAVGRGVRPCLFRVGGGRGGDADRVGEPAFFQAQAEGCGIAVAAVGDDERDVDAPRPGLVDHVQGQLPLLHVSDVGGDAALGAAGHLARIGLGRGGIPALGQEQTPVDSSRRVVGGQVQGHPGLTVGDLARGAGVLPGHTCRSVPVLEEACVIHDQRGRFDHVLHPPGEAGTDVCRVPRAGGDEVRQGLPIAVLAQACGHRFHRLAPPVQQQAPQIDRPPPALIRPRERLEHLCRELLQITSDRGKLPTHHNRSTEQAIQRTRHRQVNLTRHY